MILHFTTKLFPLVKQKSSNMVSKYCWGPSEIEFEMIKGCTESIKNFHFVSLSFWSYEILFYRIMRDIISMKILYTFKYLCWFLYFCSREKYPRHSLINVWTTTKYYKMGKLRRSTCQVQRRQGVLQEQLYAYNILNIRM